MNVRETLFSNHPEQSHCSADSRHLLAKAVTSSLEVSGDVDRVDSGYAVHRSSSQ